MLAQDVQKVVDSLPLLQSMQHTFNLRETVTSWRERLVPRVLQGIASLAGKLPRNKFFYSYTIHVDGEPYMVRVVFPRLFGMRPLLHHILVRDGRDFHNHPWVKFTSLILSGGYLQSRVLSRAEFLELVAAIGDRPGIPGINLKLTRPGESPWINSFPAKWDPHEINFLVEEFKPGDINVITEHDYHRIDAVEPNTWTLVLLGRRRPEHKKWGFLVAPGEFINHETYRSQSGHPVGEGLGL